MGFFDEPRRERRRRPRLAEPLRRRPWWGAPENELGVAVPLRLVLARTDDVAVAIADATAYTTGFELTLAVRRRPASLPDPADADFDEELFEDPFDVPFGRLSARFAPSAAPQILRFGVEFSDGRRGTTLDEHWFFAEEEDEEPRDRVVLQMGGGGGGGGAWESSFWLWPLPPPGPLAFVVEWPSEQIPELRHEVDAALVLDASSRADVLWAEPGA